MYIMTLNIIDRGDRIMNQQIEDLTKEVESQVYRENFPSGSERYSWQYLRLSSILKILDRYENSRDSQQDSERLLKMIRWLQSGLWGEDNQFDSDWITDDGSYRSNKEKFNTFQNSISNSGRDKWMLMILQDMVLNRHLF